MVSFNRSRPFARRSRPQRSGVFGSNARSPRDRNSIGLQRARNAIQGRIGGGNVAAARRSQQALANQRRQVFSGRASQNANRFSTPRPRVRRMLGGVTTTPLRQPARSRPTISRRRPARFRRGG